MGAIGQAKALAIEQRAKASAIRIIDWVMTEEREREEKDPNYVSNTIIRLLCEQRQMDYDKLKGILNDLMIDTKDKCRILEAMEYKV